MYGTKDAAASIYKSMQERGYSTDAWSQHELHPKPSEGFAEVDIVNFIFIMDLLNFSYVYLAATSQRRTLTEVQVLVRATRGRPLPSRVPRETLDWLQ